MGLFNKNKKEEATVAPEINASAPVPTTLEAPAPDFSSQLGEQQASANQITEIQSAPAQNELVPESPSMGLMENDPFTEKNDLVQNQIEETTGAQVEEPKPILEQQIALDVNIEEVVENGTTKEDEITKIVADNVAAASLVQTIAEPQSPTPAVAAPAPEIAPAPEVAAPVPEIAPAPEVAAPAPEIAPTPEVAAPAPEIAPTPAVAAPAPEIAPTPAVAAPAPEIAPAPEVAAPVPEIAPAPEVAAPAPEVQPTITLEPGPITDVQPGLPVAEPIPQPEQQPQSNPFNGVEAPKVTENEIVAPTMDIAEQQLQTQISSPETNQIQQDVNALQQVNTQQMLTLEPGPILNTSEQNNLENHDLSKFFVEKDGVMVSQDSSNAEIPSEEQIQESVVQTLPTEEQAPANLNIDIQNPVIEPGPIVEQPVVEITQTEQSTSEPQIESTQQTLTTEDTMVQPEPQQSSEALIPKPIVAPIVKEEEQLQPQEPTTVQAAEPVDKKVIVQSVSLGRVQPVAPIAVLDNQPSEENLSLTQKLSKITQEEQATQASVEAPQIEEIQPTIIEDQPTQQMPPTPEINQNVQQPTIDTQEPVPNMEKPVQEEAKLDVEQNLHTTVSEVPEKMSRNSRRKILRGKEKFTPNKPKEEIITEPIEEKKGLTFCESCGNLISSVDVICPSCGDPIK